MFGAFDHVTVNGEKAACVFIFDWHGPGVSSVPWQAECAQQSSLGQCLTLAESWESLWTQCRWKSGAEICNMSICLCCTNAVNCCLIPEHSHVYARVSRQEYPKRFQKKSWRHAFIKLADNIYLNCTLFFWVPFISRNVCLPIQISSTFFVVSRFLAGTFLESLENMKCNYFSNRIHTVWNAIQSDASQPGSSDCSNDPWGRMLPR